MATYAKHQKWKEEKSERLRGEVEGDLIKFINLRCARWPGCTIYKSKKKARPSIDCML